jgi:hypothetical protein
LVFVLKAWICLLEGMGFYTTGSPESNHETFMDMNNPARDELMQKNDMDRFLEDTNQRTPSQGDYFSFPSFGNVGSPLMTTLNIPGLNARLPVWLWTTPNVLNALDSSHIITLYHGNHIYFVPSPSTSAKFTPPHPPPSGESLATSN